MPGWTLLIIPIGVGCAAILVLAVASVFVRFIRGTFHSHEDPAMAAQSGARRIDEVATRDALRLRPEGKIAIRHVEIEPLDEQQQLEGKTVEREP